MSANNEYENMPPREQLSSIGGQPYPFKDALANWFEGSPKQARITVALVLMFYLIALVCSSFNVHFAEKRESGDDNRDAALVFSSVGIASSLFGMGYLGHAWFSYDNGWRDNVRRGWNKVMKRRTM